MKRWWAATLLAVIAALSLAWRSDWFSLGYYLLTVRFADFDRKTPVLDLENYRATIDAVPIEGIPDDASGLTFHPERKTLFTVINKPPQVAELTTDGKLVRAIPLRGVADAEGITHQTGNFFFIADEGRHQMIRIEIDDATREIDTTNLPRFGLRIDAGRNVGYEGVSWDSENRRLFIVKEKNPLRIFEIGGLEELLESGKLDLRIDEWLPESPSSMMLRDLSSLTYHEESGHLLLLSDESRVLLEFDDAGRAVDMLVLRAGWHGLKRTIPQAEGVAIGSDRAVYILSEPNLFYRFTRPAEPVDPAR
ncbi:MAG: SdiA-regulated domain-containing protein [Propionivibrio sp.]